MGMMIFIEDSFDSAHYLPHVPEGHKCGRMHGHTYRVRIEISGEVDAHTGFIVDYAEVKERWGILHKQLDHQCLNDIFENPTCEVMADWIGLQMTRKGRFSCSAVELRETQNCGARWTRD